MIYADNAATTKLDMDAFGAMKSFLLDSFGNPSQPYGFSRDSRKAIKESRKIIAECIGADPEEIVFTSCGTESDNWAIKMGVGTQGDIITSVIEHHAILDSCRALEKNGRKIIYIPVDSEGMADIEFVKNNITENTKLISVMFANNEIGTIQPIGELVKIAHSSGCLFHTDAVQAVGHIHIDVHNLGVDLLSASAHKFNGPKGIGFIYIKNGTKINSYMNGGSQEGGRRAGTENVASIVAMAVALKKNWTELDKTAERLLNLEQVLLDKLKGYNIDFIRNGSSTHIPGNMSLSFKGCEGEMLLHRLDLMGICVSTGSACDSVNTELSHVIKAIAVPDEYALGTIRISLGKDNTEEEVKKIAEALNKIIKE